MWARERIPFNLKRDVLKLMQRAIQFLLLSVFTTMLGLGIINPIMSIYAQDLGATMTQIGLLSSAWSISRLIFSAPVGKLSDKKSKKMIIAAGLLVYSIVSIFYVLAWDFTSLVLIRFIHGLGSACILFKQKPRRPRVYSCCGREG